jgi:DNA-binding MarR family transcriptional regulator
VGSGPMMRRCRPAWHPERVTRPGGLAAHPDVDLPEGGAGAGAVDAPDPGMSDAELAARLRVTMGLLVRRLRQRDPGHLSPAQLSALVTIEAAGPVRSGDLAARENVSAPTMTRMVGAMEEAGLVARRPDPSDARGSLISLTPGGSAALDALRRERNNLLSRTLSRLPADQRTALVAALPALESVLADLDD